MLRNQLIFDKINELGAEKVPFFFLIDFDKNNGEVVPIANLDQSILYSINNTKSGNENNKTKYRLEKKPISFLKYEKQFEHVHHNIQLGNSYLTNLTCKTEVDINLTLDQIYLFSQAKYKLKYKDQFVCFSPERFIKIKEGFISSNPMKGTIDASIPFAEKIILEDEKEKQEHATIVDLIRNDLSMVAEDVKVTNYRYTEEVQTSDKKIIQVSSEIQGKLPIDYNSHLGDIFNQLLPAGSISGAPKQKTVEIIKEAENYERGFYTGVFGVYDGFSLDSAVLIRFLEKDNDKFYFKSGGGITAKSDCKKEYLEMIQKIYVPIY